MFEKWYVGSGFYIDEDFEEVIEVILRGELRLLYDYVLDIIDNYRLIEIFWDDNIICFF